MFFPFFLGFSFSGRLWLCSRCTFPKCEDDRCCQPHYYWSVLLWFSKKLRKRGTLQVSFYHIITKICIQILVTCELFLIFLICQSSAVNVSKIIYKNISGTTKSEKAIKFACSDAVPCSNIVLSNVNLEKKDGTVETYCNSAQGFGYGTVHPSADCLTSHDKNHVLIDQTVCAEPGRQDIVHTELW